ncbi:rhomboid family intramembrane serine protease [Moraxella catarrhalis]|uniref:rhomboid family intramembrane serine protease n=1 Tax=Moraxella catarrhalis TaxID=480 RepID=UPI00128D1C46|nr:rhomboid family intramembrane serine protease [Moraxella catarrhalis]MPX21181.1 rhomboid family intramembrane serine protease [Moraxella catarrhalis]
MNFSTFWQTAPLSLLLILSFIGLAIVQLLMGVDIDAPSTHDLLRFGANFMPLSMVGEPWRLLSSGFLHIGILHLLFNSFAMYYFGQVAEIIISSVHVGLLFILAVVGGNLLGNYLTWQAVFLGTPLSISAGASGGIMGLGAFLFSLALLQAPIALKLNTKTLGFAVKEIDHAGHIGGTLVGFTLGVVYRYALSYRQYTNLILTGAMMGMAMLFGVIWYWLHWQIMAVIG